MLEPTIVAASTHGFALSGQTESLAARAPRITPSSQEMKAELFMVRDLLPRTGASRRAHWFARAQVQRQEFCRSHEKAHSSSNA